MKCRKERGAVIAEAAVVIGLLFFFLLATMEFGRIYNVYQVITDAAREGARFSALSNGGTQPTAQNVANQVCSYLNASAVQLDCTVKQNLPQGVTCNSGTSLPNTTPPGVYVTSNCTVVVNNVQTGYSEVDVAVPYRFLSLPFGTVNIRTRAVMRNETN